MLLFQPYGLFLHKKDTVKTKSIKIDLLEFNQGQIVGLPANPRFIRDEEFENLKKSIQDYPEMLNLREILVAPYRKKYVVIAGNMRLRACLDLNFAEVPCKVLPKDTTIDKLRAYTIKDNVSHGKWDFSKLTEWDPIELGDWNLDVPNVSDIDIDKFFEQDTKQKDDSPKTMTCPHCNETIEL